MNALSQDDIDWYLNPVSSDPKTAVQRLASEVICEAVSDFRTLTSAGVLIKGRIAKSWLTSQRKLRRKVWTYSSERDVKDLLDFFKSDKCDRWLEFAQFNISAARIREQLGI